MKPLFTREEMECALNCAQNGSGSGIGLYREGYRSHGANFWGMEAGSKVREFLDLNPDKNWRHFAVLEIGAGTGKNILEIVRRGINRAVAVEIDSIAASIFINSIVRLEEAGFVPEGKVALVKDDALRFLQYNREQFDVVICYGVMHTLKQYEKIVLLVDGITSAITEGGHLILQAITNKYPAPLSQPELDGIIVTPQLVKDLFPEDRWEIVSYDDKDIFHSHAGSEENHRHGSVRLILKRL